jgi:hypothetical protein
MMALVIMLIVTNKPCKLSVTMLSVVILSVVMLSAVAPIIMIIRTQLKTYSLYTAYSSWHPPRTPLKG